MEQYGNLVDRKWLDVKIIGLYVRGMSVNDIKPILGNISPTMISKITDKVINTANVW